MGKSTTTAMTTSRSRTAERRAKKRGREETGRTRRGHDREKRHAGSVARVVSGAVAGGRLACTLRRDARRRSISDHPLLPPTSHPHNHSTPARRGPRLTNQQPTYPRRQTTLPARLQPAIASRRSVMAYTGCPERRVGGGRRGTWRTWRVVHEGGGTTLGVEG